MPLNRLSKFGDQGMGKGKLYINFFVNIIALYCNEERAMLFV